MAENPHENHRKRAKEKFTSIGFPQGTPAHEILELLLFYAIPRRDTNPIAHRLINEFGSLEGVFNAPLESLKKIDGINEHSAVLIKLIPQIHAAVLRERASLGAVIQTPEELGTYLLNRYAEVGFTEALSVICLGEKGKLLSFKFLESGNIDSLEINCYKLVSAVIETGARAVALAHCHSDITEPSQQDINTTLKIKNLLSELGITLIDHIIIAGGSYTSLAQSQKFGYIFN